MAEQDQDEGKSGRAQVRALLLDRLDAAGMVRPRGVSAEAHAAMQDRLADHLAYMAPENLSTLAEVLMDHAQGPGRNGWPMEVVVRQFAHALQRPPEGERRLITSWLASREGPNAEMGGYLVELYRWLRASVRPPLALDLRAIREAAAQNQREMAFIRQRAARGAARPEDAGWLSAYERDQRVARDLVAAGANRRDKSSEGAAA